MHAARLEKSDRLRRVAQILKRGGVPVSTREIIQRSGCCAINSIVAELRCNGMSIDCRRIGDVWYYRRTA